MAVSLRALARTPRFLLTLPPLAALWTMTLLGNRFAHATWVEALLAVLVMVVGWDVLRCGVVTLALGGRAIQDTLAALAAGIGLATAFLIGCLEAAGRLEPTAGGPLPGLLYGAAATAVAARLLGRELARKVRDASRLAPLAVVAPPDAAVEARLPRSLACAMAASIAISIAMVVAFDERAGWPPLGTTLSAVLAALLATGAEAFSILHGSRFSNPNLRRLGALQTVFFRRSGVITEGRPEITTVTPLKANATAEDVLHIASVAEYPVAHPIREAVLRRGMTQQRTVAPVRDARLVPGRGIIASLAGKEILFGNLRLLQDSGIQPGRLAEVSAAMRERKEQGESVLYACLGGEVVGAVSFLDRPRPDAGDALRAVAAAGFATGILSGDAPETVAAQTQALGAPGIEADLSAAERLAVLERSRQEGKGTALVSAEAASPTGEAAGFQLEVRDPGGPVGSGVRHGPPPLSVRCANLREVAQVLVACKSWRREARRQFLFLGLYQALLVPLLSGAFESWTGVPPSPALAAWLGAVLPYALLLL